MSEKFNYLQFMLSAEKNRREDVKINKLVKGLSDEQLEMLIQMTESKSELNIIYER